MKYPLHIKTNKLRGGCVEDVWLRDFTGRDVERDVVFIILDDNGEAGTLPVTVRNITIERMRIDGAGAVLDLVGLDTDPIRGSTSPTACSPVWAARTRSLMSRT